MSTQFVVGPGPLPVHDQDFRPYTVYGASKVLAEKAVRDGRLECVWTIVRPTNVWGSMHPRYPHIRFSIDQSCDPFAEESMVVDGKKPYQLRIGAHDFSPCGIT
ncbi:MAG: hypothetical protein ACLPY1_22855 [Terracidiphilus sp.]